MPLVRVSNGGTSVNYIMSTYSSYRYIVPTDGSNGIRMGATGGTAVFPDVTFTATSTGIKLNKPCTVYNVTPNGASGIVSVEEYAANQNITLSGYYPISFVID